MKFISSISIKEGLGIWTASQETSVLKFQGPGSLHVLNFENVKYIKCTQNNGNRSTCSVEIDGEELLLFDDLTIALNILTQLK